MPTKDDIANWFQELQHDICSALEKEDGKARFMRDEWTREGGGGGLTRVIQDGNVIEKGGVNFSAVHGKLSERIVKALDLPDDGFFATGVSIVIHPNHPFVPIIHMNVRYFEMDDGTYWFGGGIDLTPHYVNENDAEFFHRRLKETCNRVDPTYYHRFKKWADDYFYIPHRKETRGVGGIFFDRLSESSEGKPKQEIWQFVQEVGKTFAPTYVELMSRNKERHFSEEDRTWQFLRRGRYVEFNLVYDKGTKFGLETDGRIESILMSLPTNASWFYDFQPEPGSAEEHTLSMLRKGVEWC